MLSSFKIILSFIFMFIGIFSACIICAPHGSSICGGQKEAQDPLRLELQMVVSCFLRAGNQTWDL